MKAVKTPNSRIVYCRRDRCFCDLAHRFGSCELEPSGDRGSHADSALRPQFHRLQQRLGGGHADSALRPQFHWLQQRLGGGHADSALRPPIPLAAATAGWRPCRFRAAAPIPPAAVTAGWQLCRSTVRPQFNGLQQRLESLKIRSNDSNRATTKVAARFFVF